MPLRPNLLVIAWREEGCNPGNSSNRYVDAVVVADAIVGSTGSSVSSSSSSSWGEENADDDERDRHPSK
jgi:hypothetical protein